MKRVLKASLAMFVLVLLTIYFLPVKVLAQEGNDVKQLYEQGLMLGIEGRFSEAKDVLNKASSLSPENMPIDILLLFANDVNAGIVSYDVGRTLFSSVRAGNISRWESALKNAKTAIDIAPRYAPAHLHIGTIYAAISQSGKDEIQNTQNAINAYKKAIEINPNLGLAHYNLGVAYAVTKDWGLARAHLSRSSSLGINVPPELTSEVERCIGSSAQVRRGGFFDGLTVPLSFVPVVISGLFDPKGIDKFNQHLENTWGQGSTIYRIGFVLGVIIPILIAASIGSIVSSSSIKKRSQEKKEGAEKKQNENKDQLKFF